jgi:hypothetical protein
MEAEMGVTLKVEEVQLNRLRLSHKIRRNAIFIFKIFIKVSSLGFVLVHCARKSSKSADAGHPPAT